MERKQRIMIISVICVVICVILAVILVMVIPKPEEQEEPKPWWEQRDKLEFVLEDERSIEKTYSYKPSDDYIQPEFNYIKNKSDQTECIPELKIYFDGVEQSIINVVVRRKIYYENLDSYQSIGIIKGIGIYRATIYSYLTQEDAKNMINEINDISVNIIIRDGIEK